MGKRFQVKEMATQKVLSILYFLVSSFVQSFFFWFLSIFISKKFGLTELGQFSFVISILSPISILAGLQLRSYSISTDKIEIFEQVKSLRLIFPAILFFVTGLLIHFLQPEFTLLYLLLVLLKWSELWSEASYSLWQVKKNLDKVSSSLLIKYSTFLFLLLLLFFIPIKDFTIFFTLVSLFFVTAAALEGKMSGLSDIRFRGNLSPLIKTGLSLSLASLLTSLLVNVPRYFLKQQYSVEEVGTFSALFYFYVIPSMAINYTCIALIKEMKKTLNLGNLCKLLLFVALSALVLMLLLTYQGPQLMLILYSLEIPWQAGYPEAISLCFFFGGVSSVLHYLLMSHQVFSIQLWTNVVSALSTLAASAILIPAYSVTGAFYALLSGLILQSLVYFIFVVKSNE